MLFTRSSNRLYIEGLETRKLLAGDTDCWAEVVDCDDPSNADACDSNAARELDLKARLTGSGPEKGEAELEVELDDDGLEIEFEVEIEHAQPGSVHAVMLDGVLVGQITVDSEGRGQLRLGTHGEGPEGQPLPPDFPTAGAGSEVAVGSLVVGTLGDEVETECTHEDQHGQDVRFTSALSGPGREHGEAELEVEDDDDQLELELEVEVEKAAPGSVHDVTIDGITVAQVAIGADGRGRIRISNQPEHESDLPLPDNFPTTVGAGSVVTVGTILTGTLSASVHGDFNEDREVDGGDVDLLFAAVRTGSADVRYDLDSNQSIDHGDVQHLVHDVIGTVFGDANLDGVFNSDDFVEVFQAGQYNDGVAQNSSWVTGDWNGDGEFDSNDIVLAFQYGGYRGQSA